MTATVISSWVEFMEDIFFGLSLTLLSPLISPHLSVRTTANDPDELKVLERVLPLGARLQIFARH